MIINWDASYEATPTDSLRINLIDNVIRDITFGIRERMSVEHEWGPGNDLNDGSHIMGGTSVLATGNLAAQTALANMQEGSLFLLNTGTDLNLSIYDEATWKNLSTVDHDALTGTTDNDHPQCLLKDGGVMLAPLDMSGFMVVAPIEVEYYSNLTLKYHTTQAHRSLGDLSVLTANSLPASALKTITQIDTYVMNAGDKVFWDVHPLEFFPAIYQLTEAFIYLSPGITTQQLGLFHSSGAQSTVQVYREWIDI
jgi:hypothetical protein